MELRPIITPLLRELDLFKEVIYYNLFLVTRVLTRAISAINI